MNDLDLLEITSVDLVDEGSCSEATINLFKRRVPKMKYQELLDSLTEEEMEAITEEVEKRVKKKEEKKRHKMEKDDDEEEEVDEAKRHKKKKKKLPTEHEAYEEGEKDELRTFEEAKRQKKKKHEKKKNYYDRVHESYEEGEEDEARALEGKKSRHKKRNHKKSFEPMAKGRYEEEDTFDDESDILKVANLAPEVAEYIAKMAAQAKETQEEIKKMKIEKQNLEFIQKAKSFSGLQAQRDKIVDLYKSTRDLPEIQDKISDVLKDVDAKFQNSDIFKSYGTVADSDIDLSNPMENIEKRAESIQKEQNLTYEKAYMKALEENPSLLGG